MNAASIIARLSATNSRLEKEQILIDAFMKGHRDFFVGAKLAYDILITFGVKKVAEITDESDDSPGELTFDEFLKLADDLRCRRLTGHAARDAIHAAAERCHIPTWNQFYRRILLKDFRCGVDTSTINRVLARLVKADERDAKNYVIPVFTCQLAHDGAKPENHKRITGRKMLDIKLDGVRLLTVLNKEENTVTQYARNGKVNENFTAIREGLLSLLQTFPGSVVLDGEIVSSSFQDLMKQFSKKAKADTGNARLALFDIIPLSAFKEGICEVPQELRHMMLTQLETSGSLQEHTKGSVYVIPKLTVDLSDVNDAQALKDFNKQAIEAGYEGIMVKDPDAPYELKRSYAWLKIKPFIEVSLTIVGYEEGTGKYARMLGAWIMEGEDDGRKIKVNVGGGLTDEERQKFWHQRDSMLGFIGEVRADAMTLEQDGDVWSLRFPRWKGVRGTKPGEKL